LLCFSSSNMVANASKFFLYSSKRPLRSASSISSY
jgi:hypothetical protein